MEVIVVLGNVAVGKSHLTKVLMYNLHKDIVLYPEFIYDDSFAMEMLRRRFEGTVSAVTFQNFILDKWEYYYECNKDRSGIKLFERLPDDAVKIFAKSAMDEDEYKLQKKRLEKLDLPSYKDMNKENCTWIRYENNFTKDLTPLIEKVSSVETKYVVVEVRSETAYKNYRHRNRKEEFYTQEQIAGLQVAYNEFCEKQIERIGCEVIAM